MPIKTLRKKLCEITSIFLPLIFFKSNKNLFTLFITSSAFTTWEFLFLPLSHDLIFFEIFFLNKLNLFPSLFRNLFRRSELIIFSEKNTADDLDFN